MNKTIRLTLALAVVMLATSACKTKQKIAEIPAGANIEATAPSTPRTVVTKPTPAVTPKAEKRVVSNETEVTRNENFSLADGETNADALKFKYHVVVGSFTKQTNAKGLESSLNKEGNKSVVVVNEKGMFRVLMTSVNDYNQAHSFIKNISTRFPDAWVLVQK